MGPGNRVPLQSQAQDSRRQKARPRLEQGHVVLCPTLSPPCSGQQRPLAVRPGPLVRCGEGLVQTSAGNSQFVSDPEPGLFSLSNPCPCEICFAGFLSVFGHGLARMEPMQSVFCMTANADPQPKKELPGPRVPTLCHKTRAYLGPRARFTRGTFSHGDTSAEVSATQNTER